MSGPRDSVERSFRVAADHPCLPGHFPGRPLVPAVVMLDAVAAALREWRGLRITRVAAAKFVAPLLPGQDAMLRLALDGGSCVFRIERDQETVAQGRVETAA